MAAEDMRVNGSLLTVPAQVSGHKMGPYGVVTDPPAPNDTEQWDFFDGDIGLTWDMLDGRCAVFYGDCGGAEFQGGFGRNARAVASRLVNNGFTPTAASDFAPGGRFAGGVLGINNLGAVVPTSGICHIQTGVGPGGWASFSYTGKFTNPNPGLSGVVLLCGGGTISPGQAVEIGTYPGSGALSNPRTNGGYRGNLLAVTSNEDLGSGVILDDMLTHADGCAIEALPFTLDPASVTDCYPTIGSGGIQVTNIERTNGIVTVTTATPHGLTTGTRHNPTGPPIYLENVYTVATTLTGGPIDTATATTISGANAFGFVSGGGTTSTMRRIAVQLTNGRYSIVQYTSSDLHNFYGCTVVNGVTGTANTGASIRQGLEMSTSSGFVTSKDWMIHDIPSTTSFRFINSFQPDRAGGLFTNTKVHVPDIDCSDPPTAKHAGLFPVGGFSVPHPGATNDVRHCVFALDSHANGAITYSTGVGLHYSDTGGLAGTWTRAPLGTWNQEADQTAPIRGLCAHYDADDNAGWGSAYVLGITAPEPFLWRVTPGDELDRGNYEYWTGGDPTDDGNWSNDETDATALDWPYALGQRGAGVTSMSLAWLDQFSCWMVTYFPGGEGQDTRMLCRFSDDLVTWNAEQVVFSGNNFPLASPVGTATTNGYAYGGFIHPWSGACRPDLGNDPNAVVLHTTLISPYQVYAVKVPLYSLESVETMPKTVHGEQIAAASAAKLTGFKIQTPTIYSWDGWVLDDHTWTRVDADTITCVGDMTPYIQKYDPFSCHDGTATRYAYVLSVSYNDGGNGLTTVNLIPHNDGASTGSILSNGAITAVRWSKGARPQDFPKSFAYTATIVGIGSLSVNVTRYSIVSGRVKIYFYVSGTSTGTTHSITGPVANAALDTYGPPGYSLDNTSTNGTTFPFISGSASVITFFKTSPSIGTWTGSGTCSHRGVMEYEAAA